MVSVAESTVIQPKHPTAAQVEHEMLQQGPPEPAMGEIREMTPQASLFG